jgi:hypothetical protein
LTLPLCGRREIPGRFSYLPAQRAILNFSNAKMGAGIFSAASRSSSGTAPVNTFRFRNGATRDFLLIFFISAY